MQHLCNNLKKLSNILNFYSGLSKLHLICSRKYLKEKYASFNFLKSILKSDINNKYLHLY